MPALQLLAVPAQLFCPSIHPYCSGPSLLDQVGQIIPAGPCCPLLGNTGKAMDLLAEQLHSLHGPAATAGAVATVEPCMRSGVPQMQPVAQEKQAGKHDNGCHYPRCSAGAWCRNGCSCKGKRWKENHRWPVRKQSALGACCLCQDSGTRLS